MAEAYRVKNRHIYRSEVVDLVMGKKADGSDHIVRQPGPMTKVEAGTILTDVREEELAAFPDRFELVEGDPEQLKEADEQAQIAEGRDRKAQGDPVSPQLEAKIRKQDAKDAKAEQATKPPEPTPPPEPPPLTEPSEEGASHTPSRRSSRASESA